MNILTDGVPLGEIDDVSYFIAKRNRLVERGCVGEVTKKVDAQLLLSIDAFKQHVETAIAINAVIGRSK